jgi:opacity protein-like surface antigen
MKRFLMVAAAAGSILAMSGAAHATVVTFDDAAGNSILDVGQSIFTDQGLTFTNSGTYMYVWDGTNPNGNGTNANIFAGFNTPDYETITLAAGGAFDLNSLQLAISWYDPNPTEVILVNGNPLTITDTLTTYNLNLDGVTSVTISGVPSDGGYWLADNINFDSSVPEPMTIALFGAGLLGLGALRRRKAREAA